MDGCLDRLHAMSLLLEAVEAGSLSAAGRRLGMPLATVSRKISELEAHLGTRLFHRSRRQLMLTEAGRSYSVACKRILEDVEEAERAASGEYRAPKGDLTITTPIVFGRLHVLPVVMDFLQAFPDIDIRIVQADRVVDLLEEPIDLAVRIGELPDSSLVAIRVGSIRRVLCGSPAYFAERGTPKSPGELGGHDCVTFEGVASPSSWSFAIGGVDASVAIHSRLIVNTAEAAIDAAMAGFGNHARTLLPDRRCGAGRKACGGARRVRAAAVARQSRLCRPAAVAAKAARLPRFCGAPAEIGTAAGRCAGTRSPRSALKSGLALRAVCGLLPSDAPGAKAAKSGSRGPVLKSRLPSVALWRCARTGLPTRLQLQAHHFVLLT